MEDYEKTMAIKQEISERYNMSFPEICLEPLWWGRRPDNRVDGRFAIVDQKTDLVYNVCTDMYKPVHHEVVIKLVEDAASHLPEFGTPVIKPQLLADGGKLRVNVSFPEVQLEVKVGDLINPFMDVFSSYDLGWKYSGRFGANRLICSNGAAVSETFEAFKRRHLVSMVPEELQVTLKNGLESFSDQTALWQQWTELKVLPPIYEAMWEELPFSKTEREKIENTKEIGTDMLLLPALRSNELTMWSAHNIFTQFATHDISSDIRRVEILPLIERVFEKFTK